MLGLFVLLGLLTSVTAEYGCSSFAQLSHTMNGCPANEGNPDCSFIQANAQQFCSTVATSWEIINGPACNLRGASYGCIFASGLYSTTDQFCCPLIITGGTSSPSASASPSASPNPTVSSYPSASPNPTSSASTSSSPSPSPSSSVTPTSDPSSSVTPTSDPSLSVTPSAYPSLSPKPSLSATATATSTGTFTAIPSTNVTTIYITTTSSTISSGVGAAIGLSAVFGFCILGVCCIGILRRRPSANEIQKQVSIVDRRTSIVERRASVVEDGKERRKSALEIRSVN